MRPDLAFLDTIKLDDFDDNSIYVKDIAHWRPVSSYINDYIYFTRSYSSLSRTAKLGFSFDYILSEPDSFIYQKNVAQNIFCPEEILAKHINNKNISVKTYPFNIDLARHHQ